MYCKNRSIFQSILVFCILAVISVTASFGSDDLVFIESGTDDGVNVEITNVNIDNFPNVHLYVRVTDNQGFYIPDLSYANFEVREDGELLNCNVEAQFGYMAVSLVMDASGSMGGFEDDVIAACNYFVNGLDELDKGAVVEFATVPEVVVEMTYNKDELLAAIAGYNVGGGTALWQAIYYGIDECFYEPEKKAVIAFTDGNNNGAGYAAQLPPRAGTDITIYTIGIGAITADSLIWLAEQTGGFYLPIDEPSQMGEVLEDIRNDIGNLYDIHYVTPDPVPNGTTRSLQVVCSFNSESGWDTTTYTAPTSNPPTITLTTATQQLLGNSQTAGASIEVSCLIQGENTIEDARVYYKTTGAAYFSQDDLIYGGANQYSFDIPGTFAASPGIEFYFQTTDIEGNTVTYPQYSPGYLPLTIPVLPNIAPSIAYYPPEEWLDRRSIVIDALIEDDPDPVQVSLFYRVPGDFFYYEYIMELVEDGIYRCMLEGPQLNEDEDLEFFIAAWESTGFANYWNNSEIPFTLNIVAELTPTPPAVALEPVSIPIIIPATGGSFEYNMFLINPIPDTAVCDVWADMVLPDGTIEEAGLILDDVDLEGGEVIIDAYTQEVPEEAMAGDYLYRVHTGDYTTGEEYYLAGFTFIKDAAMIGLGRYDNGWLLYPSDEKTGDEPAQNPVFLAIVPELSAGNPNPFNSSTMFRYRLPENSRLKIAVHNINGEEVQVLADGFKPAGSYQVHWNAAGYASGIYFCRLTARKTVVTSKVLLVK